MPQIFLNATARIAGQRLAWILLTLLSIGIWQQSHAQHWTSGVKATGSSQTEALYDDSDIVVDGQGNAVIAGYFRKDRLSFGAFTVESDDDYYEDIFICRIGADQTVQWLKKIEAGRNYGYDLALSMDDDKNIYLTASVSAKIFVTKYDSTGLELWTTKFDRNSEGDEIYGDGTAVTTDMYDNVYVTGGGGWNFFMSKINKAGEVVWVKDLWHNYSAACYLSDIDVDAVGNIYFAGSYSIDLTLGDITLPHGNRWNPNVFWGKVDTEGNFVWVKSASGRCMDRVNLAFTADGNLFLAGGISGLGLSFDGYYIPRGNCCDGATSFIAKSDLQGKVLWATSGTNNYSGSVPIDAQVDYTGNLYLTGVYYGSTEMDYYVEKYNADGQPLWRRDFASGLSERSKAIDLDNRGFLYLLGVNASPTFIDEDDASGPRTYGVGKFDTESSTYKRTARPPAVPVPWICDRSTLPSTRQFIAEGEQIRWYSDAGLLRRLGDGGTISHVITQTDTLYVTQTVAGVESWPTPVVMPVSSLPAGSTILAQYDTLFAPKAPGVQYQWLYKGVPIKNATQYFIGVDSVDTYDNFTVALTDGPCEKILNIVVVSIEQESKHKSIVCYPNPTTSSVFIGSSNREVISSVRIKNSLGQELSTLQRIASDEYRVDLSEQKAGLYIVDVVQNNRHYYVKVIKR